MCTWDDFVCVCACILGNLFMGAGYGMLGRLLSCLLSSFLVYTPNNPSESAGGRALPARLA